MNWFSVDYFAADSREAKTQILVETAHSRQTADRDATNKRDPRSWWHKTAQCGSGAIS
jgi:hypothetical protein